MAWEAHVEASTRPERSPHLGECPSSHAGVSTDNISGVGEELRYVSSYSLGHSHTATTQTHHYVFVTGDVIYFRLFRTPTVVLNSLEGARDLLDKRSAKYLDRPRMVLLSELRVLSPLCRGDRIADLLLSDAGFGMTRHLLSYLTVTVSGNIASGCTTPSAASPHCSGIDRFKSEKPIYCSVTSSTPLKRSWSTFTGMPSHD